MEGFNGEFVAQVDIAKHRKWDSPPEASKELEASHARIS